MAVLELSFESKEESLSVRRFSVREGISTPFEVSVLAASPDEDLDLDALVGKAAGLLILGGPLQHGRVWTGIVSHMEQVDVEKARPGALGLSLYHLRIAPSLWLLGQRRQNRIFQDQTILDIVDKILGEYGIKAKKRITEEHPKHDYRVQWNETDLAFVSRLLEEEGVSYFFGQSKGDAGVKSELVLCDQPHLGKARPPLPYVDNPNQAARKEFVGEVQVGHRVRPGRLTIRDFDFTKPDYLLLGRGEKAAAPEDFYEQYLYEHGAFTEDKPGGTRATVALQALRNNKRRVGFQSNAYDLAPGVLFTMEDHPRDELAADKKLLVVELAVEGAPGQEWSLHGGAVFADVPFRPAQLTPRPRISGVQSAIVVGPKGEEIYTDESGRVKVQFHWDRDGKYDDKSSCWLRVSQGWAGAAYGMLTLPRIGQEVLVSFWEGNPDEPVVTGRVYNAKTQVPYKLPDHKTKSTWKSDSSPKSDGFNELMFEDKKGQELVYIQAQRDLSKLVKRNETERTGANRTIVVGANRTNIVGAIDTTLVGAKYSLAMVTPKDLAIHKLGDAQVEPGTTLMEMVEGKITLTTGKATVELDGGTITLKADGNIKIKAGGDVVIQGGPFVKINC